MKPLAAPNVPGDTEFERFDNAVRQILTVSKQDLLRTEAEEKQVDPRTQKLISLEESRAIAEQYLVSLNAGAKRWVDAQHKGKP